MTPASIYTLQGSYALVKTRGSKSKRRLQLPVLIGSSGLCDIVINAGSVAPHAYTVYADGNHLRAYHQSSNEPVPLSALVKLGVELSGPIAGDTEVTRGSKRLVREALNREADLFTKLPTLVRGLLLGALPQPARLAVLGSGLFAALVASVWFINRPSDEMPDLSDTPISLTYDVVRADTIGFNPKNLAFMQGYQFGASFVFEAPEGASALPNLLAFTVAGMNFGKEISIEVNGRTIFESEAEAECSQQSCPKTVRIEKGLLMPGENTVKFVHHKPESSYFLANIHIRALPPIKPEESEQILTWLAIGQRAFDERQIVPENLVAAERNARQALKLASERDNATELAAKSKVLIDEVAKAFASMTTELWASVEVAAKLGRNDEATKILEQLLRMYPDPSSEERVTIQERLQEIKETAEGRR